ncbi:ankyrin repeat domain-containing protein EMB506, chloroplastic-like [Actinia tenebrosa]|uniref:Ankyrin repeat domain-containing protein EMB506, chloroplastic-like n=1 Tax=Actinia tenebrosa TaxID=6105 RepID=A0A6P8IQB8_ACTTE|nr:ankyrin repeat domain-containing protein EMB506, chloroplastic-like [Actinia tenebrosa]
MQRRRKISLQEHFFAKDKSLDDISECEDLHGAIGTIKEEDGEEETERKANSGDESNKDQDMPFLHKVVAEGDIQVLSKMIESGADINVCDSDGWPPLNTAIRQGKTECAALLLKHGAGDFFFQRQKEQYVQRLQTSKRTRRRSHWM